MISLEQFDRYLNEDGPAALVIREHLVPVEGPHGILFPPTFAAGDSFPGGYNIDQANGSQINVCIIDTVGSQANRIEPLFKEEKYRRLVPQITITAGAKQVNLLDAGHRAGDAIARCSSLQGELRRAFESVLKGDMKPLAKIAPTSLVFGVWDSRDTQAKVPRLLTSTIRAFNVERLSRSAQYVPAIDYIGESVLDEPVDKAAQGAYSERGFMHVPATGTHGGVIAKGGVRRDSTLSLGALRLLSAGSDQEMTRDLQRYILGLALVGFTASRSSFLRQGCMLVLDPEQVPQNEFVEVYRSGKRQPTSTSHDEALQFAVVAAAKFGVGESKVVPFDKGLAISDLKGDESKAKGKRGKKAASDGR